MNLINELEEEFEIHLKVFNKILPNATALERECFEMGYWRGTRTAFKK